MVLIYCVPFQCLWTEEKETEDLEVRSIFLCILYRIDYRLTATSAQTRKLKFVLLVQIVILIFLLSNNITVLIIRFEIWLSESSCHCHLLHLSNCKNKKGNFFLSYSSVYEFSYQHFIAPIIFSHYCKLKTNKMFCEDNYG